MANEPTLPPHVTLDLTRSPEVPADYRSFKATAQALQVIDEDSFAIATEMIQKENAWAKKVDEFFDEGRELAHRSWRWFTGAISKAKEPYAVRSILEPRMKKFRADQIAARQAEERRIQREAEQREREAREEAARIQREAEAKAAELRKAGEMRAAKDAQIEAARKAVEAVEAAQILADVGTVLPDAKPQGGPGESRPWVGEVLNVVEMCKAIGTGSIPLEYLTPVRGKGEQMLPLVTVDMTVLNHIAKRMGRENIGVPGARGKRDIQMRFGKAASVGKIEPAEPEGWE